MVSLRLYEDAHDGKHPDTLDPLIGDEPETLDAKQVYLMLPDGAQQARWQYFPENIDSVTPPKPIFVQGASIAGRCVVGMSDSGVQVWHVEHWQDWLLGRPPSKISESSFDRRLQSWIDWLEGKYDQK